MNFEVLTVVQLRNMLYWDVMLSPGKQFQRFKGMLHLSSRFQKS
jgi:hypothetical protein